MSFLTLIPSRESLLALEPEELGGVMLQYLATQRPDSYQLNQVNFLSQNASGEPEQIKQALVEAWAWLDRDGLIAKRPGSESWYFVTRRGRTVATPEMMVAYRKGSMLPRKRIHPKVAKKVWAMFLRGDYDTAVFQSFKELEVAVRAAAKLAPTDVGVDLMRKAFRPSNGPLSDPNAPLGEQEALMHLMAGAIGSYKNPHSHRNLGIGADEASEMVMLATHLISIVDKRAPV